MKYIVSYIIMGIMFLVNVGLYYISFPLNFLWQFRWKACYAPYPDDWIGYDKSKSEVELSYEYYLTIS